MVKDDVFQVVKTVITNILSDIDSEKIKPSESLRNLGANSVDRMEIVIQSMENLGIKIPLVEFGKLNNIQELVDLLYEKKMLSK